MSFSEVAINMSFDGQESSWELTESLPAANMILFLLQLFLIARLLKCSVGE